MNKIKDVRKLLEELNEIEDKKRTLELKIYPYMNDESIGEIEIYTLCNNCNEEYTIIQDNDNIDSDRGICPNCEDKGY
ncbi:hypothetical protein [Serratia sp. (in: enterobacteria)]|uniref:hypothetical protein n=1 Tax=Serratia sp. (in: enterobacteria) TaxID=616 RepID=UPI003989D2BE